MVPKTGCRAYLAAARRLVARASSCTARSWHRVSAGRVPESQGNLAQRLIGQVGLGQDVKPSAKRLEGVGRDTRVYPQGRGSVAIYVSVIVAVGATLWVPLVALGADGAHVSAVQSATSTFIAEFTEQGLPAAVQWSVELDNMNQSAASGSQINFTLAAGNYTASFEAPPGFIAPANVSVDGVSGQLMIGVAFEQAVIGNLYSVQFNESGLPGGTGTAPVNWSVILGGQEKSAGSLTDQTELEFEVQNGTYAYSDYAPGFNSSPSSGSVDVQGNSRYVAITFSPNGSASNCKSDCGGIPTTGPTGGPSKSGSGGFSIVTSALHGASLLLVVCASALVTTAVIAIVVRSSGPKVGSRKRAYRDYSLQRASGKPSASSPPVGNGTRPESPSESRSVVPAADDLDTLLE